MAAADPGFVKSGVCVHPYIELENIFEFYGPS